MDKVRMAFVGLGWWSDRLAEVASKSNKIEIFACHSRADNKMDMFVNKYGGIKKKTYEDVMTDDRLNAIVLTTPNSFHANQTIEAAKHGKHIFVEKPIALTVEEGKKMIAVAEKAGVILAVGHNTRRMARYRKAQELIKKGAVGEIVLAETNSTGEAGMKLTPEMWRWYRKESPGGPLMTFTIHYADNFNHLIGPTKRVRAFVNKVCGKAEADDVVSAVVEFERGALGYIGGSFITPARKYLQIHGVDGVVLVDEDGGAAYYQKKDTSTLVRQPLPDAETQRKDSLAEELDEFARCIIEGGSPEVTGKEGLEALAIMEAIVKSSESGLPVEIKSLLQGPVA